MTKLRVQSFSLSLDGYGAGPHQDLANPPGVGGMAVHQWFTPKLGHRCTEHVASENVLHVVLKKDRIS